jgi:hypothetical protein
MPSWLLVAHYEATLQLSSMCFDKPLNRVNKGTVPFVNSMGVFPNH